MKQDYVKCKNCNKEGKRYEFRELDFKNSNDFICNNCMEKLNEFNERFNHHRQIIGGV